MLLPLLKASKDLRKQLNIIYMKKTLLILSALTLISITRLAQAQIINPGFETWTTDALVPSAMNPNSGNGTTGWWEYNYFNNSFVGSSPISVSRCTDTVHSGNYSVRLQTKVYTPTSWNIYNNWGTPFIGHSYNDTLGILFNGNVNTSNQTYKPGIPLTQKLTQFKFYYQYKPNGADKAECRVSSMSSGTMVAGGLFSTTVATGTSGWQLATINFTYVNTMTPDTLFVLFSSSSLDGNPKAGSILWIDDVSVTLTTGIEQLLDEESIVSIYPNPSNGIITINQVANNNKPLTIEVYNVLGEKIYADTGIKTKSFELNIADKPNGVYIVKLIDGEKTISKRIIVK